MTNEILNTCLLASEASPGIRTIASYSHVIPIILSIILGIFVLIKAKFNFFSKVFLSFIITYCLWLVADFFAWTSNNYHFVYTTWSVLDFIEIVFYILGLYFAIVFVRKKDLTVFYKLILSLFVLPPFFLTIIQQSVTGFYQSICEASNNEFLGVYKLIIEIGILLVILFYTFVPFFKKQTWKIKRTNLIVLGSMFLFLSVFGVTEYVSSMTGVYEINLYSLFLLPVFILAIIYAVFELDIFNFHILGTHYLVVGLVVLVGGQLFFINGTTDRLLTILTILMTIGLSIILYRNLRKESNQRIQIEKLNIDLGNLIRQRESLVHLITHKVKGSFTRSKYIFSEIIEGSFGAVTPELKKMSEAGLESDDMGIKTVDLILNASNLQKGTVKYDMKPFDFKELVLNTIENRKDLAGKKGLVLKIEMNEGEYTVNGDIFWLKEVVENLIDNSLKYTQKGEITVGLKKEPARNVSSIADAGGNKKMLFYVKDTGIGITPEDKKNLFTEGGRGKESVKFNVDSTGYGLYSVKLIVEAHHGRVWAESEGRDKGSQFFVEFDAI